MATKKATSSKKQSGKAATANTELVSATASTEKLSATDKALKVFANMMIERIENLQAGDNWRKPWFNTSHTRMAMPCNMEGRPYHNMNALLLYFCIEDKHWSAPCFGTFNHFLSLNPEGTDKEHTICVRKGEVSLPVFYYRPFVVSKDGAHKITVEQYDNLSKEEQKHYTMLFSLGTYKVFNIDQTNMKEVAPDLYQKYLDKYVKQPVPLPEGNGFHIPAMDKMIAENLWDCPIKLIDGDRAFFRPSTDEIQLPLYEQFESGEAFYGTAWHEMSHSTGHPDRLNRLNKAAQFGNEAYAFEELIAELSSALIAHTYGIDKELKDESAKYLKSWLQAFKGDLNFVKEAMQEVGKASKLIIDRMEQVADGEAVIPAGTIESPTGELEPVQKPKHTKAKPESKVKKTSSSVKSERKRKPETLAKLPDSEKLIIGTNEGEIIAIRESYFEKLYNFESDNFVCKNAAKQFDECDVVLPDVCFNQPYDVALIESEIDKFNAQIAE